MAAIPKDDAQPRNFREMYNKKYGDIVALSGSVRLTPEQLFEHAIAYFEWAEDNALKAAETASYQGEVTENRVHKVRVFTKTGFCLFCAITETTYDKYREQDGYKDVIAFIESVIREQKYQLAASGIVNAPLMIKDLGLDKGAEVTVNATATANEAITKQEIGEAVKSILEDL